MLKIDRQLITHPLTRPALRQGSGDQFRIKKMRGIIAHWTANTNKGADAQANRNYFNNGSPGLKGVLRPASAHYCVDDRRIIQCLPDHEVGYHVGGASYKPAGKAMMSGYSNVTPNYFCIGFEMCVNSDGNWFETYDRSAHLAAWLLVKHDLHISQLLRHYDITGKDCPKMFLDERPWSEFRETVAAYRSVLTDDEDGPGLRPFRVLSPDLNVRSTPDTQFAPLYTLQKGEVVLANAQAVSRGKWVEIEDGKFVNGKFLGNALSL